MQFRADKGSYIASLALTKDVGIAYEPNEKNYGHFTFHEYADVDLQGKMKDLYEIFKEDEEFID